MWNKKISVADRRVNPTVTYASAKDFCWAQSNFLLAFKIL